MNQNPQPRVVIVEDEAVVAMDIRCQLESLGYEVVGEFVSGEDACERAPELEPDLVLLDIELQGEIDGITAASRFRELGTPVVFLTAYADEDTLRRAKAARPQGYILKPFDDDDLRVTVEMALHRHRLDWKLQKANQDLLAVLDAQRSGAVVVDTGGRITFVSRAARRLLGVASESVEGSEWTAALALPEDKAAELKGAIAAPSPDLPKVRIERSESSKHRYSMEIEVVRDPRDEDGRILFLYDVSDLDDLRRLLDGQNRFENIVGESRPMKEVFTRVRDLAPADSSVLLEGETGTGKELVARAIHNRSSRKDGPFVAVNCGGLSDELAASQFFGHSKGAFTGAISDHEGLFEAAHGGTLFLDEVGELSPKVQTVLLRILDQGTVSRIGESRSRQVDVRMLAATNRDLAEEIRLGRYRPDLFYRIRVAHITLPPLRERREDIPVLVRTFVEEIRTRTGRSASSVSDATMRILLAYRWPGNVRELKNALEFAVLCARGKSVQPHDLPPELREPGEPTFGTDELEVIRAVLAHVGNNRKKAAELLGVSRATLYRRLEQWGLSHKGSLRADTNQPASE